MTIHGMFQDLTSWGQITGNVLHDDVEIAIKDSTTSNFAIMGAPSLSTDANSGTCFISIHNNLFCSVSTHEEHLMICFG